MDIATFCIRQRSNEFPYLEPVLKKYRPFEGLGHICLEPRGRSYAEVTGSGWKFHLSVAVDHVGKAWEIVVRELIERDTPFATKVISPHYAIQFSLPEYADRYTEDENAGKIVTIYDGDTDHAETVALMSRLEQKFAELGINKGPAVKGDRAVPGSSYLSYRNDRAKDGSYSRGPHYNAAERPDPFEGFGIQRFYRANALLRRSL